MGLIGPISRMGPISPIPAANLFLRVLRRGGESWMVEAR